MKYRYLIFFASAFLFHSCGRYSAAVAPEYAAPKKITNLQAGATEDGLVLAWMAPEKDRRGKRLKDREGYRVYRREGQDPLKPREKKDDWILISEIEDNSLKNALAQLKPGQSSRNVKIPEEQLKFSITDKDIQSGKAYLYKVVPINQGGVKGAESDFIRIVFSGSQSDIVTIENTESKLETD